MSKVTSQNTNFQIQNQQNQRETDLTQDKTQIWKASHFVHLGPSYIRQVYIMDAWVAIFNFWPFYRRRSSERPPVC